jgi:hypothetical protein
MLRRRTAALAAAASLVLPLGMTVAARALDLPAATPVDGVLPDRKTAAVVLTGAQLPAWSRTAATGTPKPWPSGALDTTRDAHNGTYLVPPDARTGVDPGQVAAFRWDVAAGRFVEIPVQVDQRFPYFLANGRSDFGVYSGTDTELTYQWDTEAWKMDRGDCTKAYAPGDGPMADPVPTLDDDDEIAFMASDAGPQAPAGAYGPSGTTAERQEVVVTDPLSGVRGFAYLFLRTAGSAFDATNGYVHYERAPDADQWIDKSSFPTGSTEALGTSNGGYGPNLEGTVCDPDGTRRTSTDRFPRDGVTVSTRSYRWGATGRWMVRSMQVARPDAEAGAAPTYGPDLIDRWKGRAFQSSPDSSISVVGFEDEQVNWEANSSLLGERMGSVRAIRETWGADSGTNVTKTETFYRDAVAYRYHLRVHPIPPDGLYTAWDYNHGVATHYFNALHPEGVAIDGRNDNVGQVDRLPVTDQPAFFNAADPTFDLPLALLKWEQVSGDGADGSLVYVLENKGATTFTNPLVVPFYRDDACFDDGTGDDPVRRPWPGEASTDARVRTGYETANGGTPYAQLTCAQRQGAWGENGVHFFATGDTDNAFVGSPVPVDEVDAQQWQFAVPTDHAHAVGEPYAQEVRVPVVAVATPQANTPAHASALTVTGATTAQITDAVRLAARLDDVTAGRPIAGAPVTFSLQGRSWTATTDAAGVASVVVDALQGPAGTVPLRVDHGGADGIEPSTATTPFEVRRDDATLVVSWSGAFVTARLRDADSGVGLGGRSLALVAGDGRTVATMTTDASGSATTLVTGRPGSRSVHFGGDATYLAADGS